VLHGGVLVRRPGRRLVDRSLGRGGLGVARHVGLVRARRVLVSVTYQILRRAKQVQGDNFINQYKVGRQRARGLDPVQLTNNIFIFIPCIGSC
jgi:hypothetical protein